MFKLSSDKPQKKLQKAAAKFLSQPAYRATSVAHYTFAQSGKEAYESVMEVIDAEREFRLNALFKRGRLARRGLANLSDDALLAHKGWAMRVVDTADYLLARPDPTVKGDPQRALESLVYAQNYLEQNLARLTPPKDSMLDRAWVLIRAKCSKAYSRLNKPIRFRDWFSYKKPAAGLSEEFKTWDERLVSDLSVEIGKRMDDTFLEPKPVVGLPKFGDVESGPASLVPENQGINGEKTPPKNLWPFGDKNEDGKCHWCEDTGTVVDHLQRWGVETGGPCGHCSVAVKPKETVPEIQVNVEYCETGDTGGSAVCPCGEVFRFDVRPSQNCRTLLSGMGYHVICPKCGREEE